MLMMLAMLACGENKNEDTSVVEPSGEDTSVEDTDTEETDTDDTEDTQDTEDTEDTQEPSSGADAINVGEIVITEIMKNPCGVTGSEIAVNDQGEEYLSISCTEPQIADETGEWFEIYNASDVEVNLNGAMVHEMDDGNSDSDEEQFVITEDVIIAPGSFVVLGTSADTAVNGGVNVDYVYAHSGFQLSNGADEIAVSNTAGILDSVMYNDDDYPDYKGHSLSLNPSTMTAADNDSGANWCAASTGITSGDLGTPGAANDACP